MVELSEIDGGGRLFRVRACRMADGERLSLVVGPEHLTARSVVDPELLYESPFTDVDLLGVSGVFNEIDAKKIVDILRSVRSNAAA